MGLSSHFPRGGAPKRGWVTSEECIIGALVGIEELTSRAEERGYGGLECGMGWWSAERRNCLRNEIEEVQSRLRSSDEDSGASILVELRRRGEQGCNAAADV